MEGSPSRIDRAALDRIIQRAAELQTSDRDIGDSLSPDDVVALGREVGIPGHYLQQALLEERTRIVSVRPTGMWDRIAGPGGVAAQRVFSGDADEASRALIRYMEVHELLCIQRQQPGRITWEPMSGFHAAVRRSTAAFGAGRMPFMLARAATVAATIAPLESGYVHVALQADLRPARREYVGAGAAFAAAGAVSAVTLATLGAFLPIVLLPLTAGLGFGYGVVRQFNPRVARIQLGLERALDHLEQGVAKPAHRVPDRPAGILGFLADEVRRALNP